MTTAFDRIKAGLATMEERQKSYGPAGYEEHGKALAAVFPDGLTLKTWEDFTRFVLFIQLTTKYCRYAKNFAKGGHQDSIHDMGNYSFILEAADINLAKKSES